MPCCHRRGADYRYKLDDGTWRAGRAHPWPWLDHNCTTRLKCVPFTSSVVAFPGSSSFTASCNGRRCTDAGPQQAPQPSFYAAEWATKFRTTVEL
jgi:hypothetical protein